MKYNINRISTPFGGFTWSEEVTFKDRFKYLLFNLEGKRVLVNPKYMEIKQECIESALEIKSELSLIIILAVQFLYANVVQ